MNAIPMVARDAGDAFARRGSVEIKVAQFCGDIESIAAELPPGEHLINLCQDRYTFTVTFFAALLNRQTNLLPAKRDVADARVLAEQYASCRIVSDQPHDNVDACITFEPASHGERPSPACPGDHTAAIAFTSGSTGEPQAHPKSWRMLDIWRRAHHRYLPTARHVAHGLVSTVPSWHMYGLEWAMLLPTVAPLTLHCGADFYPQDVVRALQDFAQPTVLVSTPVHLRPLRQAASPPRNVACVLSATAPLDPDLTEVIEHHFDTRIFEIYGCSEIGSLASRFSKEQAFWTFFDIFDVRFDDGRVIVDHCELADPIELADRFEQIPGASEPQYALVGRTTDLIKIGGKRESLANLNNVLHGVAGVHDGIIYQPTAFGLPDTGRLAALVVAPGLDAKTIRSALAQRMDSAFLPRPIRLVPVLPRDHTSKLKHAELERLLREVDQSGHG